MNQFLSLFSLFSLCYFLSSDFMKVYRQWVPCKCNSLYNIFRQFCTSFFHGLKMYMWFGFNFHFSTLLTLSFFLIFRRRDINFNKVRFIFLRVIQNLIHAHVNASAPLLKSVFLKWRGLEGSKYSGRFVICNPWVASSSPSPATPISWRFDYEILVLSTGCLSPADSRRTVYSCWQTCVHLVNRVGGLSLPRNIVC